MSKINKKPMNYGFKILALLAFSLLVIPAEVNADRAGYVTPYNQTDFNNVARPRNDSQNYYYPVYSYPQYQVYQPASYATTTPYVAPTVYSQSVNPQRSTAAASSANSSSAATNTDYNSGNNGAVNEDSESVSDLAASTIYGSNTFLPSGIMQWVLVAIFILLIIILARRIFGAKEAYETSPLKHA